MKPHTILSLFLSLGTIVLGSDKPLPASPDNSKDVIARSSSVVPAPMEMDSNTKAEPSRAEPEGVIVSKLKVKSLAERAVQDEDNFGDLHHQLVNLYNHKMPPLKEAGPSQAKPVDVGIGKLKGKSLVERVIQAEGGLHLLVDLYTHKRRPLKDTQVARLLSGGKVTKMADIDFDSYLPNIKFVLENFQYHHNYLWLNFVALFPKEHHASLLEHYFRHSQPKYRQEKLEADLKAMRNRITAKIDLGVVVSSHRSFQAKVRDIALRNDPVISRCQAHALGTQTFVHSPEIEVPKILHMLVGDQDAQMDRVVFTSDLINFIKEACHYARQLASCFLVYLPVCIIEQVLPDYYRLNIGKLVSHEVVTENSFSDNIPNRADLAILFDRIRGQVLSDYTTALKSNDRVALKQFGLTRSGTGIQQHLLMTCHGPFHMPHSEINEVLGSQEDTLLSAYLQHERYSPYSDDDEGRVNLELLTELLAAMDASEPNIDQIGKMLTNLLQKKATKFREEIIASISRMVVFLRPLNAEPIQRLPLLIEMAEAVLKEPLPDELSPLADNLPEFIASAKKIPSMLPNLQGDPFQAGSQPVHFEGGSSIISVDSVVAGKIADFEAKVFSKIPTYLVAIIISLYIKCNLVDTATKIRVLKRFLVASSHYLNIVPWSALFNGPLIANNVFQKLARLPDQCVDYAMDHCQYLNQLALMPYLRLSNVGRMEVMLRSLNMNYRLPMELWRHVASFLGLNPSIFEAIQKEVDAMIKRRESDPKVSSKQDEAPVVGVTKQPAIASAEPALSVDPEDLPIQDLRKKSKPLKKKQQKRRIKHEQSSMSPKDDNAPKEPSKRPRVDNSQ